MFYFIFPPNIIYLHCSYQTFSLLINKSINITFQHARGWGGAKVKMHAIRMFSIETTYLLLNIIIFFNIHFLLLRPTKSLHYLTDF
jgi:hypothetical protein